MRAKLELHFPHTKSPPYPVPRKREIVAGKSERCDLNLADYFAGSLRTVSREHFKLSYNDGHFTITDISLNGVRVNGQRLIKNAARTLADGDEIKLANEKSLVIVARLEPVVDPEATEPVLPDPSLVDILGLLKQFRDVNLLGVAGAGKTTLLKTLAPQFESQGGPDQPWSEHPTLWPCYINCMAVDDPPSAAGFFRLLIAATKPAFAAWPDEIRQSYDLLSTPACSLADVKTAMGRTVQTVYRRRAGQLVFLLDQFDNLYPDLPEIFVILKELKLSNPPVIYVLAMQNEFEPGNVYINQFLRALHAPVDYWLPPFEKSRLKEIIGVYQLTDPRQVAVSLESGGGQPRLTELVARAIGETPDPPAAENDRLEQLLADVYIVEHCRDIWASLRPDEQEALKSLAGGAPAIPPAVQNRLAEKKSLLTGDSSAPAFQSPLFEAYVKTLLSAPPPAPEESGGRGLSFDEAASEFVIDGQRLSRSELTPLEERLLLYLYQNAGEVCPTIDISTHVWAYNDPEYAASSDAIARVISSLRKKLNKKSPGSGKRYIENVHGRGYKVVRR